MNVRPLVSLLLLCMFVLGACTFVSLDPGAESVDVLDEQTAAVCERIGRTSAKVLEKVLFLPRNEAKMGEELSKLARNSAIEMEGNAVAALGPIEQGRQDFGIYRCPAR